MTEFKIITDTHTEALERKLNNMAEEYTFTVEGFALNTDGWPVVLIRLEDKHME